MQTRIDQKFFLFAKKEKPAASDLNERQITKPPQCFTIKKGMHMAPVVRRKLSVNELKSLDDFLASQDEQSSYVGDLKKIRRLPKLLQCTTLPRQASSSFDDGDSVQMLQDASGRIPNDKPSLSNENYSQPGANDQQQPELKRRMRVKLLQFHTNYRPPYYGTWRKRCSGLRRGRRPFAKACTNFDYDVESDDDWEEEPADAEECKTDEEDSELAEDVEDDDGFIVDHGYLSSDENVHDESANAETLDPEARRLKMKVKAETWKAERLCRKWEKLKPICVWNPQCKMADGGTSRPVDTRFQDMFSCMQMIFADLPPVPHEKKLVTPSAAVSRKSQKRKSSEVHNKPVTSTTTPKCKLLDVYFTPPVRKVQKKQDIVDGFKNGTRCDTNGISVDDKLDNGENRRPNDEVVCIDD